MAIYWPNRLSLRSVRIYANMQFMKTIVFYTLTNDRKPVAEYIKSLPSKQAEKVVFVLDLVETSAVVPQKFLKKLKATDGIWEVRVQHGKNIFRLLGFFDGDKLLILNHAFTKKTQKTPKKEIKSNDIKITIVAISENLMLSIGFLNDHCSFSIWYNQ